MKYVSEAIYRITVWFQPDEGISVKEFEDEFDLEDCCQNSSGIVEVVFETSDVDERDRACAWLEARR